MDNLPYTESSVVRAHTAASNVYATDEFRLYCHKILPCSKRTPHDWASCNFAHPGEKAKRRNIRTHSYDCEMCPDVVKGIECKLGANCPHSHNVFESWLHPQKYRTLMCKDGDRCSRPVCFFAHGPHELRTPSDPTPLPQQIDVNALAAATAAAAALPMQSVNANTASLAGGAGPNWQLVQNQLPQVPRDDCSMNAINNASALAASTSTGNTSGTPAGFFLGPACSAPALLPSAAAGLQHAGTVGGGVTGLGFSSAQGAPGLNSNLNVSPGGNSGDAGVAGGALNEQALRLIQQAASQGLTSLPSGMSDWSMQQLMNTMMQQVNMSRQEAEQCRTAAAQAQQQLLAMTASLSPQGASDTTNCPTVGGALPNMQQQLQFSSDLRGNLESYASDVSSNLTHMDLSSASFCGIGSQQHLYSAAAAAASGNVWRTDSNSSIMMPVLSRTGSGTGSGVVSIPASGPSRLMQVVTGDGSGPLGLGVSRGDSGPLALDVAGAAGLQQWQQPFGAAGSSGTEQRVMVVGTPVAQLGVFHGHQQLQQVPGLQGAVALSASGPAGTTPLMYLL